MQVYSLEEEVTIKDDKRASSQQGTLYANLTSIHRMKLDSRDWYLTESNGKGTSISAIGLNKILKFRMINLIECLDQVGMLFLSDLRRQECTKYTSQHVCENPFPNPNKHRWRQGTRCVGHEIALLPEYAGEITNCSHLKSARRDQISYFTKYAEESHNVSRTSPSARRTSLVLLRLHKGQVSYFSEYADWTQQRILHSSKVLRQEFALLRVRGQRLVLGRVYQSGDGAKNHS